MNKNSKLYMFALIVWRLLFIVATIYRTTRTAREIYNKLVKRGK